MQNKVFFPYGVSNFAKIATKPYMFVDKTPYLEKLEEQNENYVSFLRPRRFGKSLFISLLEYYYDIVYKDRFQQLFGKYYIGKNSTPLASSYRVLSFNFSGIDTASAENSYLGFYKAVAFCVESFITRYAIFDENQKITILNEKTPELLLKAFFQRYKDLKKFYSHLPPYRRIRPFYQRNFNSRFRRIQKKRLPKRLCP